MKILVIAAHPDDEVYGMGGTIAKLSEAGDEVHVLIVTDGCTAQYRKRPPPGRRSWQQKQEEARRANALLGVKAVHFGTLPDMRLDTVPHVEVNQLIEDTVDAVAPEVAYTHFFGDVNLDHQMVYRSTLVAVRPVPGQTVRELYCYRVPSSTEWNPQLAHTAFLPNVMVDITDYAALKEAALLAYQTEARAYPHPRSAQYVRETDRSCGLQWGMGSSEAFMLLRKKG